MTKQVAVRAGGDVRVDFGSMPVAAGPRPAPAELVVHVPAGAQLLVNDQPEDGPGEVRTLITPPLQPGRKYFYTLRLVGPGKNESKSRRIDLEAGRKVEVQFSVEVPPAATPRPDRALLRTGA